MVLSTGFVPFLEAILNSYPRVSSLPSRLFYGPIYEFRLFLRGYSMVPSTGFVPFSGDISWSHPRVSSLSSGLFHGPILGFCPFLRGYSIVLSMGSFLSSRLFHGPIHGFCPFPYTLNQLQHQFVIILCIYHNTFFFDFKNLVSFS